MKRQIAMSMLMTAACLLCGGCMFGSKQKLKMDEVAEFELPDGWTKCGGLSFGPWIAYEFCKTQNWWWGAGNPLEVHAWVVVAAEEATTDDVERGMAYGFSQVQVDTRRFDEFGSMKTGSVTTWMSEGNYQISTTHNPEKVIFSRSMDADKRVALVMRVYTRRIKHEKLRAIERDFHASFRYLPGRAAHFQNQPLRGLYTVNSVLTGRGLPPPMPAEKVEAHDGWIYQVVGEELRIGRRVERGPDWLEFRSGKWVSGRGESIANHRWARALALDADRTKRYYFSLASFHLNTTFNLEAWMAAQE